MARSKSQKARLRAIREGRPDPALRRGKGADFSTHTRRTPSKVERQRRVERKHKGFINL